MSPLEQELAELRRHVEVNNAIATQAVEAITRITATVDALVQAITTPAAGVDPQLTILETLVQMGRKQTAMLAAHLRQTPPPC